MSVQWNELLQYLQPTEFYTPMSTTVQPTTVPALMGVQNSAGLHYFVAVHSLTYTPILPTFF